MQDFNNLTYTTSDQHTETTDERLNRDIHDLAKINSRLIPFTPFSEDRSLRNIVTGIEAPSDTNVHEYKEVGMNIINTMVSQSAFQYYFKRKNRAKTLGLPGDADIDIVKTVVDSSHQHSTTLIREDTDLYCYYTMLTLTKTLKTFTSAPRKLVQPMYKTSTD